MFSWCEWGITSSNSLSPEPENTSYARGGGLFKLRFDWYIIVRLKKESATTGALYFPEEFKSHF